MKTKWFRSQWKVVTMKISTNKVIKHARLDIVLSSINQRERAILLMSATHLTLGSWKKTEKMGKHQNLHWEIKRIWRRSTMKSIPVAIGPTGTISRSLHNQLDQICIVTHFETLKKVCLLGIVMAIRHTLNIWFRGCRLDIQKIIPVYKNKPDLNTMIIKVMIIWPWPWQSGLETIL